MTKEKHKFARGEIVKARTDYYGPEPICYVKAGRTYVVSRLIKDHNGYCYVTILGEDNRGHDLDQYLFKVS